MLTRYKLENFRFERFEWPVDKRLSPSSAYFVGVLGGVEFREKLTIEAQQDLNGINRDYHSSDATKEDLARWFIEMVIYNQDYKRMIRDKKINNILE